MSPEATGITPQIESPVLSAGDRRVANRPRPGRQSRISAEDRAGRARRSAGAGDGVLAVRLPAQRIGILWQRGAANPPWKLPVYAAARSCAKT